MAILLPSQGCTAMNTKTPVILSLETEDVSHATLPFNVSGEQHYDAANRAWKLESSHRSGESAGLYRMLPHFKQQGAIDTDHRYVRLVYKALNKGRFPILLIPGTPTGTVTLTDDASLSGGEWTVTPPALLSEEVKKNYMTNMGYNTLAFMTQFEEAEVYVRQLAFFKTEEEAWEYYGDGPAPVALNYVAPTLSIGGTDISSYRIVIPENTEEMCKAAAKRLADHIELTYRTRPEIVTDALPSHDFEILIGDTNRKESLRYFSAEDGLFPTKALSVLDTVLAVHGTKLVIAAPLHYHAYRSIVHFCIGFLTAKVADIPKNLYLRRRINTETHFETIEKNLLAPEVYTYTFADDTVGAVPTGFITKTVNDTDSFWGRTRTIEVNAAAVKNGKRHSITVTAPRHGFISNDYDYMTVAAKTSDGSPCRMWIGGAPFGKDEVVFLGTPDNVGAHPALTDGYDVWSERWKLIIGQAMTIEFETEASEVFVESVSFYTNREQLAPISPSDAKWAIDERDGKKVYAMKGSSASLSWLHAMERNTDISATVTAETRKGKLGLFARMNNETAGVFAGYDFDRGVWFISDAEGVDFVTYTNTEAGTFPTESCRLKLTVSGRFATLSLNGKPVIKSDTVNHLSQGRPGLMASADAYFSDVSVMLLGREGRVEPGAHDCTIPTQYFVEGGTVLTLKNGDIVFMYNNETQFISHDCGNTWEPTHFTDFDQHVNVFRLQSGKLVKLIERDREDSRWYGTMVSADDGKTWVEGGDIAPMKAYGVGGSCLMDDRFTQVPDGRLFMGICYNGKPPITNFHRTAWMKFFYSDDDGMTWTASETSSIDLTDVDFFAESLIIATADGTLRMMTSWARSATILYSESKDRGVTWGPLKNLESFECSVSTFAVRRDLSADRLTYYLVWTYDGIVEKAMPRTRLGLARSYDGVNWEYLADADRHEYTVNVIDGGVNHSLDCFIEVNDKHVYVGAGKSPSLGSEWRSFHHSPREYIVRFDKDKLTPYEKWPERSTQCVYVNRT